MKRIFLLGEAITMKNFKTGLAFEYITFWQYFILASRANI